MTDYYQTMTKQEMMARMEALAKKLEDQMELMDAMAEEKQRTWRERE